MIFTKQNGAIKATRGGETILIEPWGHNALRVRTTRYPAFSGQDWALTEPVSEKESVITYSKAVQENGTGTGRDCGGIGQTEATITNGRLSCTINRVGILTFYRDDVKILQEHYRFYDGTVSKESRCLKLIAREYKAHVGGDYRITQRFEPNDGEKIFGMGQYQQPYADLKGCTLDLEQRNSQISVPFAVSSLGYGFLWNNPAVGKVTFGKNRTEWVAGASKEIDYWITADEGPREILKNYTEVTGHAPMVPDGYLGLWQSKLRYRTQEEVLQVAHAYRDKGIPLDVIVIDFFHWTLQGDWKFDTRYWPDPKAMIDELHEMGIKVVVSIWPSVDKKSENFYTMAERGLLIRTERGSDQTYDYQGDCVEIDPTNPETRRFVWEVCKKNYYDLGVDVFWLDNSEPDYVAYDFDNYRYYLGPALSCSNIYPQFYSRIFYDNEIAEGNEHPVNLLRSCWAGSQKYANVVWSGDVPSTWEALRDQLAGGINMGLAGIPWWTTDIGGFMTDDVEDPDFRELLIRWYEFAAFTAFLRMHGDRGPYNIPALDDRDWGGGYLHTGQPNELWSYGEENFRIMKKYLDLRLSMKDYLERVFAEAHENGSPILRALFYEFPEDKKAWEIADQFLLGSDVLVAPVMAPGVTEREVYLPAGKWEDLHTGEQIDGVRTITAKAPLDIIPVYRRTR
ncbi:MAG: family 31 glucosidase [Lachnospiraceae bacterium]|nr:family 31 glucosidase [Lachnospiraceae bacterium]